MGKSNYPPAQLADDDGKPFVGQIVQSLVELANKGKPKDVPELRMRVDSYFQFCADRNIRPGIETLSLCLGVTRMTFWNWCRGDGASDAWRAECNRAHQLVLSFVEMATMSGRLSPPVGIFALKNIGQWRDVVELEDVKESKKIALPTSALPRLDIDSSIAEEEPPTLGNMTENEDV